MAASSIAHVGNLVLELELARIRLAILFDAVLDILPVLVISCSHHKNLHSLIFIRSPS